MDDPRRKDTAAERSETGNMGAAPTATTSSDRELVITRVFDGPCRPLFKAWIDAKHVSVWWGPHGFTNPVCELDVRPGGAIRIHMRGPDGTLYPMTGVYQEIVEPERLAFTSAALDEEGNPLFEVLNTVTFTGQGGKTTLRLQARVVKSTAGAAPYLKGMEEGWTQSLERFAAYVGRSERKKNMTERKNDPAKGRKVSMNTKPPATDIAAWLKSTERQVRRIGDSRSALLRRRFDAALDTVWAACTDRDQLHRWFGDVSGDLHEGATLTIDVGADCKVSSRILRCERPHRLLVTWWYGGFPPEHVDQVELRLAADGDGTWLELEHRSDDKTDWWFGAGSGWEFALIRLSVLVQGNDPAEVSAEDLDSKLGPLWASMVVGD